MSRFDDIRREYKQSTHERQWKDIFGHKRIEKKRTYGVYIFWNKAGECIYIGKSGKIMKNGAIKRKGQDVLKRMRKKHSGHNPADWKIQKVSIIDTWNSQKKRLPAFVEAELLQAYFEDQQRLPEYNLAL